ncbi:MAG TPA: single-stranded DNA-binding protein [Phycisphaerae bacterium]|nr:single-stranded DNA-binding protein [Phycisphaerae bacterium]
MANLNRVFLMGNLTRDPQLRYTPSQTAVCDLGLATNRKWKGADGQMKEEVTFVNCTAWGRQAETIQKYLVKGQPIFVEGRLTFSQWDGKDGQKRSKLEVTVERFEFLGGPRSGSAPSAPAAPAASTDTQRQQTSGQEPQNAPDYDFNQNVDDDTIPF